MELDQIQCVELTGICPSWKTLQCLLTLRVIPDSLLQTENKIYITQINTALRLSPLRMLDWGTSLYQFTMTLMYFACFPGQWWICWQEKTNKFCCWETCCPWFVSADMPTCWPIHFLFNLSGISVFPFQVCLLSTAQPHWQCSERVCSRSLQVDWHNGVRKPIYNFQKNLSEI